jgi:hypothetical protein
MPTRKARHIPWSCTLEESFQKDALVQHNLFENLKDDHQNAFATNVLIFSDGS